MCEVIDMDLIQALKDKLIELNYSEAVITSASYVGSSVLVNDYADVDIKVVCKNLPLDFRRVIIVLEEAKYDVLFMEEGYFNKCLNFENSIITNQLYNYFYSLDNTFYGEPTIFDMFAHRDKYLNLIKEHYSTRYSINKLRPSIGKTFVHYYIILKMYENNSTEITEEIKRDIAMLYSGNEECLGLIINIAEQISNI